MDVDKLENFKRSTCMNSSRRAYFAEVNNRHQHESKDRKIFVRLNVNNK